MSSNTSKTKSFIRGAVPVAIVILCGSEAVFAENLVLEEITVTAQKRSQTANELPMAIQAFSGDVLRDNGVTTASDLVQITPGLTYAKSPTNTPIFTMRGIGFNTTNLSSTATVGLYVDEVAYAYPYMANGALFDMERVEVLKGPQGTLFGRNTTGGLINFITNKPSQELEASVAVEIGNYDTYSLEGHLNVPLTGRMAFRLSARGDKRNEGYQDSISRNDTNGKRDTTALSRIFDWEATDTFRFTLSGSYWEDQSDSVAGQIVGLNPDSPDFVPPSVAALDLNRDWENDEADWDQGKGPSGLGQETDSKFYSIAGRIEWDFNDSVSIIDRLQRRRAY